MEELAREQKLAYTKIQKILINFKKDSAERKTKEYAETRLEHLNNLFSNAVEKNKELENFRKENPNHAYFINGAFEALEAMTEEIREQLEQTLRDAIQRGKSSELLQEQHKLIIKQKDLIGSLERTVKKITEKITTEKSLAFFTQNNKIVDDYWNRVLHSHLEIIEKGKVKNDYFENNWFIRAEELYQTVIMQLHEGIMSLQPSGQATNSQIKVDQKMNIRLPTIEIPKFSGNYLEWKAFRDLYHELVHNNNSIGKAQKLFYLKSNLNGEPHELIKHLQVTGENYDAAWNILDRRFNNTRTLVAAQLKALLGQSEISKESAKAIKKLHDISKECLLAIENLGVSIESWDPLLIFILTQKLDRESHRLYEQSLDSPRELQTLKHFCDFLEMRFQTLEALETKSIGTKQPEKCIRSHHGTIQLECPVCRQSHRIYKCEKFAKMNQQRKFETAREKNLCINCLVAGHFANKCKSSYTCSVCHKKHHTLLHDESKAQKQVSSKEKPQQNRSEYAKSTHVEPNKLQEITTHLSINARQAVLLATARVLAERNDGNYIELRALIDQGSQATFMTEDAAQRLRLRKHKLHAVVSGVGNTNSATVQTSVDVQLKPRFESTFSMSARVLILPKLTGLLPSGKITSLNLKHVEELTLADPDFNTPGHIDMIIGADLFGRIILNDVRKGSAGSPIAQKTEFGWILSGGIRNQTDAEMIKCFITETDLSKELCKFWENEELLPERIATAEEIECEMHFKKNHRRAADGRYTVRTPLRIDPSASNELQGSRELALARLFQVERRFKTNSQLERMYKDFMAEYIRLGHMVPATEDATPTYYLPHHAVYKHDSTTTKLRVVFDASVKRNSMKSLNDIMMTTPNLQRNLTEIMMRWQKHRIVFTADIEKMYRQIKVDIRDQDLQRILWRESPQERIREYKLTTVTYGTAAAPFLAIRTLQQLAIDDSNLYPAAAKIVLKDSYVDDIVSGANSYKEAYDMCHQLINLLKGGGFNLRKWNSSDGRLLKQLPFELVDSSNDRSFDDGETIKALGIHWDPKSDNFRFRVHITIDPVIVTKRSILSEAARIFDPIGLLSPVTIKIKLLFQQIWLDETNWDDAVSDTILDEWTRVKTELPKLDQIQIPRWFGYEGPTSSCQIHGFSDASEKAYSAAVYIRTKSKSGEIHTKLLAGKTKVAPLRSKLSLPRLELCGALLVSRLIKEVETALDIEGIQSYVWTDSTIVLSWLQGNPHRWTTFVGNRVAEIQTILQPSRWFHVRSETNPADIASRGTYPSNLQNNKLWWEGPQWLQEPEVIFPKTGIQETELEVRTRVVAHVIRTVQSYEILEQLLQKYSSLTKLKRILSYCFRFIHNSRCRKDDRKTGPLTALEITSTIALLVKVTQKNYFRDEVEYVSNKKPLHKNSRLLALNPFLDGNGLLRVGGRLEESSLDPNEKHPIILPYNSHLTSLVMNEAHLKTLHGGTFKTLENVRRKYWILNGLKAVKGHLHRCVTCHRFSARSESQLMGNLPKPRLTVTRPFSQSGVDYAGPLTLRMSKGRGNKTLKGYVALFICMSTKAIHLEVVSDLTSQAFLAAFKRFVRRRGPVAHVYSDNATNFKGASKILADALRKKAFQTEVSTSLATEGIQWHFIPPGSPHFGGLWEAGIKATKHHMKRIVGETILTFEELTTLTAMIEACLNSRPLCPLNNDPESLDVLTPGHFLIGSPLLTLPQDNYSQTNPNLLTRWHLLEKMHQDFWKRWSSEYLSRLQQRPKWAQQKSNLQVGNIVLIKEENLPPTRWALGRIIEVHPGSDGLVRVVSLKTSTSVLKRSVTKVSLLPIVDNTEEQVPVLEEMKKDKEPNIQLNTKSSTVGRAKDTAKRTQDKSRTHKKAKRPRRDGRPESPSGKVQPASSSSKKCHFSSILFTVIFSFLFALVCGESSPRPYNITPFKPEQGLYFETVADANTYSNEWTLLVHFDLTTYRHQLNAITSAVAQLMIICDNISKDNWFKPHCISTMNQLQRHLIEVEDANELLNQQNGHRSIKRRGAPFGFIGHIENSLFGVLDEEFANKYEEELTTIRENESHFKNLLQRQISIANSTLNIIKFEQNETNQQMLAIRNHIAAVQSNNTKIQEGLKSSESFNSAALLVTLDLSSIRHIQQAILSVLTDTRYGKISTLLLTPAQLNAQLQITRQHLPRGLKFPEIQNGNLPLTLYNLMQVKTRVTRTNVLFEIRIPLLDAEYYKIYNLIPIPMIEARNFVQIQPSSKYLLVNIHRVRYSPMEDADLTLCRHWTEKHFVCKLNRPMYSLRSNVSKCEMELLTLHGTLPLSCTITASPVQPTWIRMHTANSWIYTLGEETTFDIICGGTIEQVTLLKNGVFQLQSGCVIKHSSMFVTANSKVTGDVNASFILETNIPTGILSVKPNESRTALGARPLLKKEITPEDFDAIHSLINDQQEEMKTMGNTNFHDVHHYTMTYLLFALGISIAVIYFFKVRKSSTTIDPESITLEVTKSTADVHAPSTPTPQARHIFGV